ncbi:hypothetical protein [Aquimarina sp. 2201CG5-10]|uniref:hypothetical protein n=1 Tax=Aquimarina callyspongiae TaxID=3098150 RepID=UPI002AB3CC1E|nr:hypothetical protein [Aquimarina sp. 2201CG5-10]MDY8136130.1 hypothetical protein [Aquimarina sp. 2201CG5-10]
MKYTEIVGFDDLNLYQKNELVVLITHYNDYYSWTRLMVDRPSAVCYDNKIVAFIGVLSKATG